MQRKKKKKKMIGGPKNQKNKLKTVKIINEQKTLKESKVRKKEYNKPWIRSSQKAKLKTIIK